MPSFFPQFSYLETEPQALVLTAGDLVYATLSVSKGVVQRETEAQSNVTRSSNDTVGGIIVQYLAHLYSPFSTLIVIPILPFHIQYPSGTKNMKETPLNSNSTHIHFHIPISKSIPNPDKIIPSNRAGSYDHNGGTFNFIPILEGEIRYLPDLCLHAFSRQPLRAQPRTIGS